MPEAELPKRLANTRAPRTENNATRVHVCHAVAVAAGVMLSYASRKYIEDPQRRGIAASAGKFSSPPHNATTRV